MKNRWDDAEAARHAGPVEQCVYGSQLLGADPDLVLHGGGNTSVKVVERDITGRSVEVIYVKGSGWDLATIESPGFAPLRLSRLRELLALERLSDTQMMNELRCALLDAGAPDPSVETLLHALLPQPAVQHSHSDVIVTLTNQEDGAGTVRRVYGDRVVVIPYVMPGFDLARKCAELYPRLAHPGTLGLVLLNHGIFTFGESTREAYENMLRLVTEAEDFLHRHASVPALKPLPQAKVPPVDLAQLRRAISRAAGFPMIVSRHTDEATRSFLARDDLATIASQGPATPDHVIRTKRLPLIGRDIDGYVAQYRQYFEAHRHRGRGPLRMVDPAPRVVLDRDWGMFTAGRRAREADIVYDIYAHTIQVILRGEALGEYRALGIPDLFDVEYWDLEQAKLRRGGTPLEFAGEVALVTGAASGIGRACAEALISRGASVVGIDRDERVPEALQGPEYLGLVADVTDPAAVVASIERGVERFGGLDMLVVAAGIFDSSSPIENLDMTDWRQTMAVNVDSIAYLFSKIHGLLREAPLGGRVVLIASRNVAAPGPGAASYSASKAAATQLARVAALEWAADGIRVNIVHPDAVYDTGLWTHELLKERSGRYGLSVEEYKRRNLLKTEVSSTAVARLTAEMCSPTFAYTTGAQVPIDGGNERVV